MKLVDELCDLLGIGVEEAEGLALAFEDPEAYLEEFAERLEEREITGPVDGLGTVALADALAACDLALVLPHGFDLEELTEALIAVLGEVAEEFDVDDLDEDDPDEALDALQTFVEDEGKILFQLDLDSEAHELFLIDEEEADRIGEILEELGIHAAPY